MRVTTLVRRPVGPKLPQQSYAPLYAQKLGVHWLDPKIGQQPVLSASMHARLHARSEAPNSVQRQLYKNHQEDRQKTSPFDSE